MVVTGLARFKCFQRELSVIFTQKEFWDRLQRPSRLKDELLKYHSFILYTLSTTNWKFQQ